jgi:predicted nucleic acid-binding protein
MTDLVVVDASVAVKWIFAEVDSPVALLLRAQWVRQGLQPTAPSWLLCELANITLRRVLAKEVALADAQQDFREVVRFITIYHLDASLSAQAIELALQFGQGVVYDAHYLALAEQLDCEYWTADEQFWKAVHPINGRVNWIGQIVVHPPPSIPPPTESST